MSTQPEALRLADYLESCDVLDGAAELRRLHQSEREGWRHANELEQERKRLHEVNQELLKALQELKAVMPVFPKDADCLVGYRERYNAAQDKARAAIAKAGEGV